MIHERSERVHSLKVHVEIELDRARKGEINRISTFRELGQQFGYSGIRTVIANLNRVGLIAERRLVQEQLRAEGINIIPSRDWAWMIGILTFGGSVSPAGKIVLTSVGSPEVQAEFRAVTGRVLKLEPKERTRPKDGVEYPSLEVSSVRATQAIGDLRRTHWPQTIAERHRWILDNPEYTWDFIGAALDVSGYLHDEGTRVTLLASRKTDANFLREMLLSLGIQNPRISNSNSPWVSEGIKGVAIFNLKDTVHFARNVQSVMSTKEALLESYRQTAIPLTKQEREALTSHIKYVPKIHRSPEDKAKARLERIITASERIRPVEENRILKRDEQSQEVLLVDRNGQPLIVHTKQIEYDIERAKERNAFLEFVSMQAREFRQCKTDNLSSTNELAERFGYTRKTVREYLRLSGLGTQRMAARKARYGQTPLSKRAHTLSDIVTQEIAQYRAGEIGNISSVEELRKRFNYKDNSAVYGILRKFGLNDESSKIQVELTKRTLVPSRELAWILGALAGGGSVKGHGVIALNKYDEALQREFSQVGVNLFKANVKHDAAGYPTFYDVPLAQTLGDMRRNRWPDTIREKHDWILNPVYTWPFLEGIFDTRGTLQKHPKRLEHHIIISTSYMTVAYFLSELLTRVGIRNPHIVRRKKGGDIPHSVSITDPQDIRILAQNIHAKNPKKEELLELYRANG